MIAGGGGFRVPLVYRALASGAFAGLASELVLFDVDPARLRAITAVLRAMPESDGGVAGGTNKRAHPPAVRTTTSLPEALAGTDLVFAAIRPGGTAGRVKDERVAQDLACSARKPPAQAASPTPCVPSPRCCTWHGRCGSSARTPG